jgi:hypothetical protein
LATDRDLGLHRGESEQADHRAGGLRGLHEALGLVTLDAGRIVAVLVLAATPSAVLVSVKPRRGRRHRVG